MTQRNSPNALKQAVLVISCSDARLTTQDSINTWQRRLNFNGAIFEVRCPGGGLAMADRSSAFFQSAFESFSLLQANANITEIILAFHDDCAYFTDKYGPSPNGDNERRKWAVMQEAIANVAGWSDTVYVRTLQMGLPGSGRETAHHGHRHQPAPEWDRPTYVSSTPPPPPSRMAPQAVPGLPSERATLRTFDRQIEERLLQTAESAQDVIALAEGQAREQGVMPAWRAERRAQEFINLLRDEGRKSPAEVQQLTRSFLQFYAGNSLPRTVLRSLFAELGLGVQTDGLRAGTR